MAFNYVFCLSLFILINTLIVNLNNVFTESKRLTDKDFISLAQITKQDFREFNDTLDHLLVPRISGTKGNIVVRNYIINIMKALDWTVELDTFQDRTPYGMKSFANIIATLNPNDCKRIVLSCHYDSKLLLGKKFVAATDSAVPCALIIQIAKYLDTFLRAHRESSQTDTTLQFIFFDGEEAFVEWTDKDSLYGSRHLAEYWSRKKFPLTEEDRQNCAHLPQLKTELNRIEVMVLLDLLGERDPTFYNHFINTVNIYNSILTIEQKLNKLHLMAFEAPIYTTGYFQLPNLPTSRVEDDHIPFLNKGVPILHIIAQPFPVVWHRVTDNRKNLHFPTIYNLLKIFKIFVAQYL